MQDPEESQEFRGHIVGFINKDEVIGQSFNSRRTGFDGIRVWLKVSKVSTPNQGVLNCKLFIKPGEISPLSVIQVPFTDIEKQFPVKIKFPPQFDAPGQIYFVEFSTSDGDILILGRLEDAYPGGRAFKNGIPLSSDIGFRTSYHYDHWALWDDIKHFSTNWMPLLAIWMVIWLPGFLLYELFTKFKASRLPFDRGQRVAIQIGLSIAIIPVMFVWFQVLRLEVNKRNVQMCFGLLIFILLLVIITRLIKGVRKNRFKFPAINISFFFLIFIFILTLGSRFIMVRDLAAPAWVDSVHHAVITRLIVEKGGLPFSYSPYINTLTAGYHPGFHSTLAVVHLLTSLEIPAAMLIFGQFLNAVCIFSVYLFVQTTLKNTTASLTAALITGFVTPMPAYYTSWGRYTQLAGMVILPVAIALVFQFFESNFSSPLQRFSSNYIKKNLTSLSLATLVIGGLLLTHYRVSVFLFGFFLAYAVISQFSTLSTNTNSKNLIIIISLTIFLFILGFFITAPWWKNVFNTLIKPSLSLKPQNTPFFYDFDWQYLTAGLGKLSLLLGGIGLIIAILKRESFSYILFLWVFILFLLANLRAVNLPGANFINNTSVQIFLFLPISVFCGYLVLFIQKTWSESILSGRKVYFYTLILLSGMLIFFIGSRYVIPLINPATILFREADKPALAWIDKNIPQNETILINSFYWGYGLYAGSDGGFWITPVAAHRTIPPPVLFGLNANPNEAQRIPSISLHINKIASDPESLYNYLRKLNINFVYIGAKGGVLSPALLQSSPYFKLLYESENTWIFTVNPIDDFDVFYFD